MARASCSGGTTSSGRSSTGMSSAPRSRSSSCGRSPSCRQGHGLSPARPHAVRGGGVPAAMRPNIEWRGVPFVTGLLTTIVQILSGVGGLMLDIFFQKSMLDRKTTNATKAVAQTFSHIVRGLYFGSLAGLGNLPLWATAGGRAGDRRRVARADRDRAHDRSRLPAMDARDHIGHRRGLSRPRRLAALVRMTGLTQISARTAGSPSAPGARSSDRAWRTARRRPRPPGSTR